MNSDGSPTSPEGYFGISWGPGGDWRVQTGDVTATGECVHRAEEGAGWLEIDRLDDGFVWRLGDQRAQASTGVITVTPGTLDQPLFERAVIPTLALAKPGHVAFHASAVGEEGQATIFVGTSGTGKSTSAAVLSRDHGFSFLADDVAVVSDGFEVLPGPSWAWLWANSPEKQRVSLASGPGPWVLKRIVFLTRGPAMVHRLQPIDAMATLFEATYRFSHDADSTARFVAAASALLRHVELWRFSFEPDPAGQPTHVAQLAAFLRAT